MYVSVIWLIKANTKNIISARKGSKYNTNSCLRVATHLENMEKSRNLMSTGKWPPCECDIVIYLVKLCSLMK